MTDKNPKKKVKRNPSSPARAKGKAKKLPQRRSKEMGVHTAKRIWFAPRGKGRPSKEASIRLIEARRILLAAKEPLKRPLVRKNVKRGRPRKTPIKADKPKRPRGRPRKHPKIDKPKRPRGRPKNPPEEEKAKKELEKAKKKKPDKKQEEAKKRKK